MDSVAVLSKSDIELRNCIGKGSFAFVFAGTYKSPEFPLVLNYYFLPMSKAVNVICRLI
jgi:hypothetical protein